MTTSTIVAVQKTLPLSERWAIGGVSPTKMFVTPLNNTYKKIWETTDGTNWTERALPDRSFWRNLVYGDGCVMMLGSDTIIDVSLDDGVTWLSRGFINAAESGRGLAFGTISGVPMFCVLTATGKCYQSLDKGVNWTLGTDLSDQSSLWGTLGFSTIGEFFLGAVSNTTHGCRSVDGLVYTEGAGAGDPPINVVKYGERSDTGLLMGVQFGNPSKSTTTVDGTTFSTPVTMPSINYLGPAFGDGFWVVPTSNQAKIGFSTDNGATWGEISASVPQCVGNNCFYFPVTQKFYVFLDRALAGGTDQYFEITPLELPDSVFLSQGIGTLHAVGKGANFRYYLEKWAHEVDARGGQMNRQADSFIEFNAPEES